MPFAPRRDGQALAEALCEKGIQVASDNLKWIGTALDNGRFDVTAKLGEGGMGFVYKAHDNVLQDDVVIKVPRRSMLDDPEFKERFDRENRALVKLQHPHVVSIIYVGDHDGLPYVVMRFLAGGDLKQRQKKYSGVLPLDDFKTWLPQIASALDFVHIEGFIHRDVKPANILFDARGNVFLSDFGVAKVVAENQKSGESLTGAGMLLGTPEYMAPEMIQCESYSGLVDQYALAATVYELLCGRVPFDGPTPQYILVQQSVGAIEPPMQRNPSVPEVVSNVVMAGLSKDPAGRYPSCTAFAEAVIQAIAWSGTQVLNVPAAAAAGGSAQGTPGSFPGAVGPGSGTLSGPPGSGTVPGLPGSVPGLAGLPGSGTVPSPPPLPGQSRGTASISAAAEDTVSNRGGLAATSISISSARSAPAARPQRTAEQKRQIRLRWTFFALMMTLPVIVTVFALQTGGFGVLASRTGAMFRRMSGLHWGFVLMTTTLVTGWIVWQQKRSAAARRNRGGISATGPILAAVGTLLVSVLLFGNTGSVAAKPAALTDAERADAVPAVQRQPDKDFVNSLGMTMRCLTPGRLVEGDGTGCLQNGPLWVGHAEVTVAQYLAYCDEVDESRMPRWLQVKLPGSSADNPEYFRTPGSPWHDADGSWARNNAPITGLKYSEMVAFCNWLSRQPGEPLEYRLPTTEEWECAYRAGSATAYYWSDEFSMGRIVSGNSGVKAPGPYVEGSQHGNEWDLHHMAGNVWEVLDQGELAAGGAWNETQQDAFSATGRKAFPGPHPAFGFRVVGVPKP